MVEARDLVLHHGGSQILHGIDIAAAAGAATGVTGTIEVGTISPLDR